MGFKRNLVANYLGQGWTGLMGLAFVPLYIRYLGMESYGLIGVFALLQAWLTLLDMGMTPTLNREMARFTAGAHTPQSIRDLMRSLEFVGIGVAIVIGILIWGLSAWLASGWLRAGELPIEVVSQAVSIMGFVIAGRFLEGLYRGALVGLQEQVLFNVVNAIISTTRAVGAVGVLVWISPTIEAYFIWQGIVSAGSVIALALFVHRRLPVAPLTGRFSLQALSEVWRFAGGMMLTTCLSILLTQVDKILLSRMLDLVDFGYYTLATVVVSVIGLLIAPITQAAYPRFTELVTTGDRNRLAKAYHHSAELVTVLIGSVALILFFFPAEILSIWTGDPVITRETAPLLKVLAVGTFLNGLMHIPYMLQLAHGWVGFAVRVNIVAVALLIPTIVWVVPRYGAIGAAWTWMLLNAGYVLIGIPLMHRRLLPGNQWKWYWKDVCIPISAATVTAVILNLTQPLGMGIGVTFVWLVVTGIAIAVAALLAADDLRGAMLRAFAEHVPGRR